MKGFEHLEIQLEEIKSATINFSEESVIGHGGFGKVYKGELSHSQGKSLVAIKRLDRKHGQGDAEFCKEAELHGAQENHEAEVHHGANVGAVIMKTGVPGQEGAEGNATERYKGDNNIAALGVAAVIEEYAYESLTFRDTVACEGQQQFAPSVYNSQTSESSDNTGRQNFASGPVRLCSAHTNGQRTLYVPFWKKKYKENKLNDIILKDLMQQMDTSSLKTFSGIAYLCLERSREKRPVMPLVVKKLEKSLKLQELYDSKLRRSEEILNAVKPPLISRSIKELKAMLSKGFLFSGGKTGQQQFAPSVHNSQTSESSDNTGRQNFASGPVSHNIDQVYDSANDNYFKPSLEEGPGINGFQIIGDAKPGCKLLGCGFPVRGTSLCMFQWVRLLDDGRREYIDGATNPEYVVTVDDVDTLIAVECIPMDDQGRQGEIVRVFANEQNKITCDPKMQQEIDNYMSAGQASFSVLLLMLYLVNIWASSDGRQGSKYQIRINRSQDFIIDEKYSFDLSIKIPLGLTTQFVLIRPNGSSLTFNTSYDVRMRDILVLTMRMFQKKALDE
nr:protein kinase, ATP binding site-containing protein [Tanacetum cinerariifolium]